MISDQNRQEISSARQRKHLNLIFQVLMFICSFSISYYCDFHYNDSTQLFNDKLIDVCSIFFGIFIGCLYLFDRFRPNHTYNDFLKFCRHLLYFNVVIIAYSFVIILVNPSLEEKLIFSIKNVDFDLKPQVFLFSVYIALFTIVIYRMIRFINMILIILKTPSS